MDGPYFSEQEVSQKLGIEDWCAMRRFVLVQGAEQKLRPIDDALESQLNTGYTSTFKLRLQDTDYISSLALEISKKAQRLDGGGKLAHLRQWHGRCLDLSKAYKQLAVTADHRSLAVIFFVESDGGTRFYIPNSLMFGSTAAVYSFNRVSRSLWWLITKMLAVPSGVFYDDYPLFAPASLAAEISEDITTLLDVLGWDHARDGSKAKPFCPSFDVLGMNVDLGTLMLDL